MVTFWTNFPHFLNMQSHIMHYVFTIISPWGRESVGSWAPPWNALVPSENPTSIEKYRRPRKNNVLGSTLDSFQRALIRLQMASVPLRSPFSHLILGIFCRRWIRKMRAIPATKYRIRPNIAVHYCTGPSPVLPWVRRRFRRSPSFPALITRGCVYDFSISNYCSWWAIWEYVKICTQF